MRIDEQSLFITYQNRYKLRKKELIQLVEYLMRSKIFPLEEENKRLKENIHSMLFTDDVIQERYEKASEENQKLKELLKECRDELNEYDSYTEFNEVGRYKLITKINEGLK